MSIKLQEQEDFDDFSLNNSTNQKIVKSNNKNLSDKNDQIERDIIKIKEVLELAGSSGKVALEDFDIANILKLAKSGKINFNIFEICIEEYLGNTNKYDNILYAFEALGFISRFELSSLLQSSKGVAYDGDDNNWSTNEDVEQNALPSSSNRFVIESIDKTVAKRVDFDFAIQNSIIPFKIISKVLYVGASSGTLTDDVKAILMSYYTECDSTIIDIVDSSTLEELIDVIYNQKDDLDEVIDKITKATITGQISKTSVDNVVPKEFIVQFVDILIANAVKMEVSDIHIEPEEHFVRVRYRIDGDMKIIKTLHKDYWNNILIRIKVLSGLNIAEVRRAQDGKIALTIYKRQIDFRVSTQPTIYGENVVIRILDKQKGLITLEELGFRAENLSMIKTANERPDGIIIVVGPTGSGKTTTLYSMISKLNTPEVNIMTLEDLKMHT
jgi:type II secretory ATPase GspE/PulE/Tfp pilus assembly ATPase PilB-like protein